MKRILFIFLAIAVAVAGCQTTSEKEKLKKEALKKKANVKPRGEESSDVDFQAFVGRLRKAVAARDKATLQTMMTPNFGYKLRESAPMTEKDWEGTDPVDGAPGVFQYWDDQDLWPELDGILSEKFVKKGVYLVAPPQFADASLNYDGYRAGITRLNGSWKFAFFVNGPR